MTPKRPVLQSWLEHSSILARNKERKRWNQKKWHWKELVSQAQGCLENVYKKSKC